MKFCINIVEFNLGDDSDHCGYHYYPHKVDGDLANLSEKELLESMKLKCDHHGYSSDEAAWTAGQHIIEVDGISSDLADVCLDRLKEELRQYRNCADIDYNAVSQKTFGPIQAEQAEIKFVKHFESELSNYLCEPLPRLAANFIREYTPQEPESLRLQEDIIAVANFIREYTPEPESLQPQKDIFDNTSFTANIAGDLTDSFNRGPISFSQLFCNFWDSNKNKAAILLAGVSIATRAALYCKK